VLDTYLKEKKLLWGENVFNYTHERNKVLIGRDILLNCRSNGRSKVFEGVCITFRSKKMGLLKSSMILRKNIFDIVLYMDVSFYLSSSLEYKVLSFSYSRRITCSRLPSCRFLM
jgi:ribosomal protein L19